VEDPVAVNVRLPRDLLKRIDHAAVDMGVGRPRAMEALIERGLPEPWRKAEA